MIRGKKNPLPSGSLAMGLGVVFRVTPECAKNHVDDYVRGARVEASDVEDDYMDPADEDQAGARRGRKGVCRVVLTGSRR